MVISSPPSSVCTWPSGCELCPVSLATPDLGPASSLVSSGLQADQMGPRPIPVPRKSLSRQRVFPCPSRRMDSSVPLGGDLCLSWNEEGQKEPKQGQEIEESKVSRRGPEHQRPWKEPGSWLLPAPTNLHGGLGWRGRKALSLPAA